MMIRSNDEAKQVKLAKSLQPMQRILQDFQQPFVQILINQIKHHETKDLVATYLDLTLMQQMRYFKRQLAAALAYSTDPENIQTLLKSGRTKLW